MPELPETETIARDLDAEIRSAVVQSRTACSRADVLRETDEPAMRAVLVGARIERVWRRAKMIVIDFSGAGGVTPEVPGPQARVSMHLVVQPRFTGGLLIARDRPTGDDATYICASFGLEDGRWLSYRDVRRLGTVALMSAPRFEEYQQAHGVEPLDPAFTDAVLSVLLRASRRPIKVALMDQRTLAGVGNIYANEALWLAGIDPSREAWSLNTEEISALHGALTDVLTASIAARGTSFRDYRDAHGERGSFVEQLAAYGRAGEPCHRCARRLVGTHAIDGRTTVFCPTCQR